MAENITTEQAGQAGQAVEAVVGGRLSRARRTLVREMEP